VYSPKSCLSNPPLLTHVMSHGFVIDGDEGKQPNPVESSIGQKGFRQSARKRLNPLTRNFGFRWFARYRF